MGEARILIYRYLEDDSEDEETDLTGQMEMPRTGDIVYRKEKVWKVTGVYALLNDRSNSPLPHTPTGYFETRICELARETVWAFDQQESN